MNSSNSHIPEGAHDSRDLSDRHNQSLIPPDADLASQATQKQEVGTSSGTQPTTYGPPVTPPVMFAAPVARPVVPGAPVPPPSFQEGQPAGMQQAQAGQGWQSHRKPANDRVAPGSLPYRQIPYDTQPQSCRHQQQVHITQGRQPQPQPQSQPQPQPQPQPQLGFQPAPPQFIHPQQKGAPLSPASKPRSLENVIGTNVLGILAACLTFLGLLFLGFLVIPSVSDAVKIALLFVMSFALTAVGSVLTYRKKNAFTLALLGCGCGSFFISIMLTHAFFQVIPDYMAFGLLLLWLVGSFVLVKMSGSRFMNILVHVGMMFSLCFAYLVGMSHDRIVVLLVYHVLSVVIIVMGNRICCEKSYDLGLFCSLVLSFVAVCVMFGYYLSIVPDMTSMQVGIAIAAFLVQVVGAGALSFALYLSVREKQSATVRTVLHILNKSLVLLVFFVALFLAAGMFADTLFGSKAIVERFPYFSLTVAAVVSLLAASMHMLVDAFLQRKRMAHHRSDARPSATLEMISTFMMGGYATLLLLVNYVTIVFDSGEVFAIPGIMIVSLVLIACARLTGIKAYSLAAFIILAQDFLFMLSDGYASLVAYGTLGAALMYMAVYGALMVLEWMSCERETQIRLTTLLKISGLVIYELSILVIFDAADVGSIMTLLALNAVFAVMLAARLDVRDNAPSGYWVFLRVQEFMLVLVGAWLVAYEGSFEGSVVSAVLLVATDLFILVMMLLRTKAEARFNVSWLSVPIGFCFTLTVLAAFEGFASWFDGWFIASFIMMITALLCIVAGLLLRMKPLRLYGLILVIVCIIKLVTVDIGDAEALMRVIAFIGGGIICFGISALYSYSVKKLDESPTKEYPTTTMPKEKPLY